MPMAEEAGIHVHRLLHCHVMYALPISSLSCIYMYFSPPLPGHHQLEIAQLSIKVRELTGELEIRAEETQATREELEASLKEEMELIRKRWTEEVDELNEQLKQK